MQYAGFPHRFGLVNPTAVRARPPVAPVSPLSLPNLVITAKIRINASAGEAAANMTSDMHNAWIDWWIKLVKYLQSSTAAYISTELENRNSIFDLWSIVHGCNLKGNVLRPSKTRVFTRRRDLSAIEFDCRNRIMDHPWWVAVPITRRVDWYSTSVFVPANLRLYNFQSSHQNQHIWKNVRWFSPGFSSRLYWRR